ncbi:putative PLD phosphodiesterase domain-containing protein [Seiridium cardinale]|uniref:PLD phosphodiesterase domain-containing protein n=1 Tax=Seiridium cardinale TaxID=138064 RepID=A0ABR2XJ40_9PEZI
MGRLLEMQQAIKGIDLQSDTKTGRYSIHRDPPIRSRKLARQCQCHGANLGGQNQSGGYIPRNRQKTALRRGIEIWIAANNTNNGHASSSKDLSIDILSMIEGGDDAFFLDGRGSPDSSVAGAIIEVLNDEKLVNRQTVRPVIRFLMGNTDRDPYKDPNTRRTSALPKDPRKVIDMQSVVTGDAVILAHLYADYFWKGLIPVLSVARMGDWHGSTFTLDYPVQIFDAMRDVLVNAQFPIVPAHIDDSVNRKPLKYFVEAANKLADDGPYFRVSSLAC